MAADGHAAFIWAAYGFTALAVLGLIAWTWLDGRAQRRALARLAGDLAGRPDGRP